jgi:hypothetical protein
MKQHRVQENMPASIELDRWQRYIMDYFKNYWGTWSAIGKNSKLGPHLIYTLDYRLRSEK